MQNKQTHTEEVEKKPEDLLVDKIVRRICTQLRFAVVNPVLLANIVDLGLSSSLPRSNSMQVTPHKEQRKPMLASTKPMMRGCQSLR